MTREELLDKWGNLWDVNLTQGIVEGNSPLRIEGSVREQCVAHYGSMENLLDRIYEFRKMANLMGRGPMNAEAVLMLLYEVEVKG